MKRDKQIWWFIIGMILLATFIMALFQLAYENPAGKSSLPVINPSRISDFIAVKETDGSPSKDNNKPPKNDPQQFLTMKAVTIPYTDNFITVRQSIPSWEKSFYIKRPYRVFSSFIPLFVILFFSIFYQTSRTSPGDDYLLLVFNIKA